MPGSFLSTILRTAIVQSGVKSDTFSSLSVALIRELRSIPCLYSGLAEIHCYLHPAFTVHDTSIWQGYLVGVLAFIAQLPETADIAAIEVPIIQRSSQTDLLARAVHTVLAGLVQCSGGDLKKMYHGIESSIWEFRLLRRDFFPLAFSPGYKRDHPRYISWRQPVIVLQPESSFTRHGVTSKRRSRHRISIQTERAFQDAGRSYHSRITREFPKAFRVVKPCVASSEPVRWWKVPALIRPDDIKRGRI